MRKEYNITILGGDGIGPEVIAQGLKTLDAIEERFYLKFNKTFADFGGAAIEKHGVPLPEKTLEQCLNADAVLLGAIGLPKYDNNPAYPIRPEQGLLELRKRLGLFTNIRPVTSYDSLAALSPLKANRLEGLDFVIYRELTGGIYFGEKALDLEKGEAYDVCRYDRNEISRIARIAFEAAGKRKGKVTLVDKANVLSSSKLWRQTVGEIAKEFPNITLEHLYVDNAAMQIILNPKQFDVILTSNMFGDILSDEASVLSGSLGLLPSASIGEKTALFEPCHGSYPEGAGKDIANPVATILSVAMMLDYLGELDAAESIKKTVEEMFNVSIGTSDLYEEDGMPCSEVGSIIAKNITEHFLAV